jgi:hypothetical protein
MNEIIISEQLKDKPIADFIEVEILKCEESLKDLVLNETSDWAKIGKDWEKIGNDYLEDMGNLRKEHPELFEDDPIDPYTGNKL